MQRLQTLQIAESIFNQGASGTVAGGGFFQIDGQIDAGADAVLDLHEKKEGRVGPCDGPHHTIDQVRHQCTADETNFKFGADEPGTKEC